MKCNNNKINKNGPFIVCSDVNCIKSAILLYNTKVEQELDKQKKNKKNKKIKNKNSYQEDPASLFTLI